MLGQIDYCDGVVVLGWAAGGESEDVWPVDIFVDGNCVASAVPNKERPDIQSLDVHQKSGFSVDLPCRLSGRHIIEAKFRNGTSLGNSPMLFDDQSLNLDFENILYLRRKIADFYLSGTGIEVGGLNSPLQLRTGVDVRYYDRYSIEELRRIYPELQGKNIKAPDIVGNAQYMENVDDSSQDFVIANHVIEHLPDPIGFVKSCARVIKPGGVLFLTIPDMRNTFDRTRRMTPFEHTQLDHISGHPVKDYEHFYETALSQSATAEEAADRVRGMIENNVSIHFHVWSDVGILEFLSRSINSFLIPFEVALFVHNDSENIAVLKKANS
ncbi:class I SAM-dependent methyltransferase [Azospirillum canadense]|uniref:class I SAM-dependent methyltransferase n=1 Tax=Azospirillum canadense TaxID=403962 RepID=UPI00222647AA|nr:methyltransferase domain-containing protein [Azospirillum canadense]MCW2240819.1 SAM-dependent methyltransferase [Azospirillum canadense]